MSKAIKITEDNRNRLELQYEQEQGSLLGCEGYFLIADFAARATLGILTEDNLKKFYTLTGKKLENGWFEVRKKE